MQRIASLFAATLFIALPTLASADAPEKEAKEHFAEGLRHYAEKNFEQAAIELEKSYKISSEQQTLFAWAQAERLSGNCAKSRKLFTQYVAGDVTAQQSEAAFKLMKECEERAQPVEEPQPTEPDPTPTEPVSVTQPPIEVQAQSSASHATPWYRDAVGISLLSGGAIGLIVGGFSYSSALSIESDAEKEGVTYESFLDSKSKAESRRGIAVGASVVGGLALTAGIAYILIGPSEESPPMSVSISEGGAQASYGWSF